jgi:YihY family inner membrane protein
MFGLPRTSERNPKCSAVLGRLLKGADSLKHGIAANSRNVRVVREMAEIFVRKHVARSAAALSYYLTLSVFPFLICVGAILGSLRLHESDIFAFLADILPAETFSVIAEIFRFDGAYSTGLIFIIGLSAMLTSSSAAFRSFTGIMGEIQGKMRFTGIRRGLFSFIFSIAFLASIYVSGLVILTGEWLMQILELYFGFSGVFAFWAWVRFVILFLLLFGIIFGVYIISAPKETKNMQRLPGALAASFVLVAASAVYSRMISATIRYALLYGSLASFIILMIWLYTCGIILIMGNVFNISLHRAKVE